MHMFASTVLTPLCIWCSDCRIALAGPNIKHALIFGYSRTLLA
jgi:hypothetical protein